jgi:hypothetical protein
VGLHERDFLFATPPVNQWEIVPYDVFHLMVIGLLTLLLSIFCSSMTAAALLELNWLLTHARPAHWPVMPLFLLTVTSKTKAKYNRLKGCGESVRMQIQLLPLLLSSWLDITKFRKTWKKDLVKRHGGDHAAVVAVRESIFGMAEAYRAVFALAMPNTADALTGLQSSVNLGRRLMRDCWTDVRDLSFAKTTNFHSAAHIGDIARRFGLARLVTCATGECVHGILRRTTSHSNHKHIEKDMLTAQNVRQAITFLLCGGLEHLYDVSELYSPTLLDSLQHDPVWRTLVKNSGSTQNYTSNHTSESEELPPASSSHDSDIKLTGPLH